MRSRGFGPVTVLVDADVPARGANDDGGGFDGAAIGGLEEAFQDARDFAFASREEASVVSVAIDGGAIGEIVVACNSVGAAPADAVAFDGVAIGMRADGATAGVAGEIGRRRRIRGGGRSGGGCSDDDAAAASAAAWATASFSAAMRFSPAICAFLSATGIHFHWGDRSASRTSCRARTASSRSPSWRELRPW